MASPFDILRAAHSGGSLRAALGVTGTVSVWKDVGTMFRLLVSALIAVALCTVCARADETRATPRIGVMPLASPELEDSLRKGLRELGYIEGNNLLIEWSRSSTRGGQFSQLAANLARANVDLIVASGSSAAQAALTGTTVPVVFAPVGDPVASGFVASLAKPGGRGTGVSTVTIEIMAKRLELLRAVAPHARRVAYVMNSSNPIATPQLSEAQKTARALGVHLVTVDILSSADIDQIPRSVRTGSADAVLVSGDLLFLEHRSALVRAIRSTKLPAMFPLRQFHDYGVLMSYGTDLNDVMHRAARYVDKILKGASPADLPIEQISQYELIVDLRVAHAMGIQVPRDVLLRANQIIQ